MQNIENFMLPLLLLAGAGILISSTSVRYNRIHEEFHHIMQTPKEAEPTFVAHMLRRAVLFKKALQALYLATALFIISSIFGRFTLVFFLWLFIACIGLGIVVLLYGIVRLMQESSLSLKVIRLHKAILEKEMHWDK